MLISHAKIVLQNYLCFYTTLTSINCTSVNDGKAILTNREPIISSLVAICAWTTYDKTNFGIGNVTVVLLKVISQKIGLAMWDLRFILNAVVFVAKHFTPGHNSQDKLDKCRQMWTCFFQVMALLPDGLQIEDVRYNEASRKCCLTLLLVLVTYYFLVTMLLTYPCIGLSFYDFECVKLYSSTNFSGPLHITSKYSGLPVIQTHWTLGCVQIIERYN